MKGLKLTLVSLFAISVCAAVSPVNAQVYDKSIAHKHLDQITAGNGLIGSLGIYPFAYFDKGTYSGGTATAGGETFNISESYNATGGLFSGDASMPAGKGTFGFGGFVWDAYTGSTSVTATQVGNPSNTATAHSNAKPNYALFDFHVKYMFNDQYGLQLGDRLATDRSLGASTPVFYLLYQVPMNHGNVAKSKVGVQLGLGYYDNLVNSFSSDNGLSTFVAASYEFTKNVSLDGSYWFESGSGGFSRVLLGIGIKL